MGQTAMIAELPGQMSVKTSADVDRYLGRIIASTRRAQERIAALDINSLELFRLMKFGSVGFHPIDEREINLVEQINQTWSYIALWLRRAYSYRCMRTRRDLNLRRARTPPLTWIS